MTALLFGLGIMIGLLVVAWAAHVHTITWSKGSESVPSQVTVTTDGEKNYDGTVPASTTDQFIGFTINKDNMRSLFILSTTDLTLETNSGSAPVNTISLKANKPLIYRTIDDTSSTPAPGFANPFAGGNVTALYATNATGGAATLTIRALEDLTP